MSPPREQTRVVPEVAAAMLGKNEGLKTYPAVVASCGSGILRSGSASQSNGVRMCAVTVGNQLSDWT